MSEIARADRRAARCFARVEDGCRSGRLESLSTQRAPHPSLGSQYWFTRIYTYTHAHERETHIRASTRNAYVSSMSTQIGVSHPRRNTGGVAAPTVAEMRRSCFILFRRAYSYRVLYFNDIEFHHWASQSFSITLSQLCETSKWHFIVRMSRLIFLIIPWIFFFLRFTQI